MTPRPWPLASEKLDLLHHQPLRAGRRRALTFSTCSDAAGRGRLIGVLRSGSAGEQLRQAPPALPRGDEALPVGDGELDRRQRARREDGAGDDDAGRRLAAG